MLHKNASQRSHELFDRALDIFKTCPHNLYEEAAVSGSVARGDADQHSDLEMSFWGRALPPVDACHTWIHSLGVDVDEARPIRVESDDCMILVYRIDDLKIDLFWETWALIEAIAASLEADQWPRDMRDGWMVSNLVPLGESPRLKAYQEPLIYPETLRHQLIENDLRIWRQLANVPDVFLAEAVAHRGNIYDLRRRSMMGIESMFKMLFAFNRLWQPHEKWWPVEYQRMAIKPENFFDQANRILCEQDPQTFMILMRNLMIDVLKVLSTEFEVDNIITALEQFVIE